MLTGLRHLSVGGGDNNDGTIHVGGTSNHVLDVIGVTGQSTWESGGSRVEYSMCSSGDGDTTLSLLGCLVNRTILEEVGKALLRLPLGKSLLVKVVCEKVSWSFPVPAESPDLAMIDVTNCTWQKLDLAPRGFWTDTYQY